MYQCVNLEGDLQPPGADFTPYRILGLHLTYRQVVHLGCAHVGKPDGKKLYKHQSEKEETGSIFYIFMRRRVHVQRKYPMPFTHLPILTDEFQRGINNFMHERLSLIINLYNDNITMRMWTFLFLSVNKITNRLYSENNFLFQLFFFFLIIIKTGLTYSCDSFHLYSSSKYM